MSNKGRKIAVIVAIVVVIFCYGAAFVMWCNALVELWIPLLISGALALITGVSARRWWSGLTGSDSVSLNYICHVVAVCGLFVMLFFLINNAFADNSSLRTERVAVAGKSIEEGYRTRRVGRNHTARGEKYTNYYITLQFADGRTKRVLVDGKRYYHTRNGDSVSVRLEDGALGVPVMREILY